MNKTSAKKNLSGKKKVIRDDIKVWKSHKYYLYASIFLLSGFYFYLFGNYIFFYQENLSLFVFSSDFLYQYISRPGGLLQYAGTFLTQLYFSNFYGSFVLSAVLTLITIVFLKIIKKISTDNSFALLLATLGTCFLILIQTNINYLIHNNLGFLLSGLYFLFSISSDRKYRSIIIFIFFPVFYYLTGAYAWIYLGMYTLYCLVNRKVVSVLVILTIAGLTMLLFKRIIFLRPWTELLYYPIPIKDFFIHPVNLWALLLFFAFLPVLVKLFGLIKIKNDFHRFISIYLPLFAIILTIIQLSNIYNKDVENLFNIEKKFIAGDWNGVIRQQEEEQSRNLTAQYYYNTALAESGILCERLFFAPQDYGSGALGIQWNSQIPIGQMYRGVYFYYALGLINEAHRWAFESMVIQGYRPENIKLLIKTELLNGHYKIAERYVKVLKRTLHYRNLAKKYELMIADPGLIKSDPELGEKIRIMPKDNFIVRIRDPYINITSLLKSNPDNRRAFEYQMAWLMLDKNISGIIDNIKRSEYLNYTVTPRYLEEALLFIRSNMGLLPPELNNLKISKETETRYYNYVSSLMKIDRTKSISGSAIPPNLRYTFWFYLNFK
ncbi:MAG TPA: DUF6057 family protein [Bacteroidales bacterium]|nr:DUF6057 family protein [Bacteroidales bacterium]